MTIRDELVDEHGLDEETLCLDGFDDCIMGYCEQFGRPTVVVYDREAVLRKLAAQGMGELGAQEWFEFNILGAWMGDYTPVFFTKVENGL